MRLLRRGEAGECAPVGGGAVVVVVEGQLEAVLAGTDLDAPMVLEAIRAAVERPNLDVTMPPKRRPHDVAGELIKRRGAREDSWHRHEDRVGPPGDAWTLSAAESEVSDPVARRGARAVGGWERCVELDV